MLVVRRLRSEGAQKTAGAVRRRRLLSGLKAPNVTAWAEASPTDERRPRSTVPTHLSSPVRASQPCPNPSRIGASEFVQIREIRVDFSRFRLFRLFRSLGANTSPPHPLSLALKKYGRYWKNRPVAAPGSPGIEVPSG